MSDHQQQIHEVLTGIPGFEDLTPGSYTSARLGGLTNLVFRIDTADQRIAHAPPNEPRGHVARGECVHQPAALRRRQPRRLDDHRVSSLEKFTSMPAVAPQINRPS